MNVNNREDKLFKFTGQIVRAERYGQRFNIRCTELFPNHGGVTVPLIYQETHSSSFLDRSSRNGLPNPRTATSSSQSASLSRVSVDVSGLNLTQASSSPTSFLIDSALGSRTVGSGRKPSAVVETETFQPPAYSTPP